MWILIFHGFADNWYPAGAFLSTNTKKLSGAEFDLYKANTDGEQTGDPIKQYVSDKNGKVSIENLPIGNYVLVEDSLTT